MSASSFALPVAPAPGPTVASRRGASVADTDFAALLDTASAASDSEVPVSTTPRAAHDPAPVDAAPVDQPVAEDTVEPLSPEGVTVPVPVPVPPQPQPQTSPAAALAEATPALKAAPLPTDADVPVEPEAQGADADTGNQGGGSIETDADQAATRAAQAEAPKAPAAPPSTAAPPPAAAQAAAAVLAATPKTTPEPWSDAPRTRDVIENSAATSVDAVATNVADSGSITTDPDASQDKGTDGQARSQFASIPTNPAVRHTAEAAPISVGTAAEVTTPAPVAAPIASEARPVETPVSLALSTVAHATIETTAQIAAQIVRRLESRSTRFEMALTPEGLGQVDVSMDIDSDGKLVARLAFDNPLAASEMRGRVDELRRQLVDAGFTVADDALSFTERDPGSQFFGQGSAFDRRPDPRSARAFGAASRIEADADLQLVPARWIPLSLTPDRVDMKV